MNNEQIPNPNRTPAQTAQVAGESVLQAAAHSKMRGEQARQAEQAATARQKIVGHSALETLKPISFRLYLHDFDVPALRSLYSHQEIERDRAYVERKRHEYEMKDTGETTRTERQADALETMFLYGLERNAWLGNLADKTGQVPFTVDASGTTEFDDYSHRIDSYATIEFVRPAKVEQEKASVIRAIMGFDVTVSSDYKTIQEKITRCQNDPQVQLPFGFSQIKYYVRNRIASRQDLVPRYTIGIEGDKVDDIAYNTKFTKIGGKTLDAKFDPKDNAMIRFQILSEIRVQNQLYQAMLPEESDDPTVKRARAILRVISQRVAKAMNNSIDLLPSIMLPPGTKPMPMAQRSPEERLQIRDYIQSTLVERMTKPERDKRGYQDPYVHIVNCCQNLTRIAKDGKLKRHRTLGPHNYGFNIPDYPEQL